MPVPWLIPALVAAGGLAQGAGSYFGAREANKANQRNLRAQQQRYNQLFGLINPLLGQNQVPGTGEQMLLDLLTKGDLFSNQAFNTGQDALMQMLRSDPFNTAEMFAAWEPMEQRVLNRALDEGWAQASGLGQRFGSASRREEGRVRQEQAESNTARRAETSMRAYEKNADLQAMAAQLLANLGLAQGTTRLGAIQSLAGFQGARRGADAQLLSILAGQPFGGAQPSAIPGAIGDIGQLMAFLPLLLSMIYKPGAPTTPTTDTRRPETYRGSGSA